MKKNLPDDFPFMESCRKICHVMTIVIFLFLTGFLQTTAKSNLTLSTVGLSVHENALNRISGEIKSQEEENNVFGKRTDLKKENHEKALDLSKNDNNQVNELAEDVVKISKILPGKSDAKQDQKKTLTGTVVDENGAAIIGATIIVKGTAIGTISDPNGNFSFEIPSKSELLVVSFIGYQTQEIALGAKNQLNIILKETSVGVDEVVVVGYGVQKKASVVGAISQVSGKEIMKTGGVSSMSNALTGVLPGLVAIQTNSGQPGSEKSRLIIRSVTSWNGSDPLVLIDGIKRDMNDIDPNDVENISILKDASATAVYGVEGANGVILITTKRGKTGKTELAFSGNVTMKTVSRIPEVLDSYQGLQLRNQGILNEVGMNPGSWNDFIPGEVLEHFRTGDNPYIYPNNNWQDYFINGPAYSQKVGFTLRGGTDFVKYFGSINYLHESDIFSRPNAGRGYDPSYSYNRFNFRTNLDFKLTRSTSFNVNLSGYRGSQRQPKGAEAMYINKMVFLGAPDIPIKYEDGVWASNPAIAQGINPEIQYNYTGTRLYNRTNFTTDFGLSQDLDFVAEGLKFDVQFSYDNTIGTTGADVNDVGMGGVSKYIDPVKYAAATTDEQREAATLWNIGGGVYSSVAGIPTISPENYSGAYTKQLVYQARLNYAHDFGKHSVSGLAVFKRQRYANAAEWPSYREDWVGRATYGYDNRYFFEANGAYNGSEKFGPGYRFGFFPSVSLGWTFSNEKFIKENIPFLSMGKIRYSNGKVGSDAGIPRWLYDSKWSEGSGFVYVGPYLSGFQLGYPFLSINSSYDFYHESVIGNPTAKWETAHKQNIGLETGFFNNVVTFNLDYYWEQRSDIFMSASQRIAVPNWFGASPVAANIGETQGSGWEMELKFNKTTKGFHYYANTSFAFNKDKIVYMEDPELLDDFQKREGYIIGQTKTRINNGFYNSWDDIYTSVLDGDTRNLIPGQFKQIDFNADGKLDNFDMAPYGYANRPQITYSATLGVEYKGWSAMVQFYGAGNATRYVDMHEFPFDNAANFWTSTREFHRDDSWTKERAADGTASYSIISYKVQNANQGSYLQRDASYLRLKTAEIAYTLDKSLLTRLGVSKTRVFLNGNNLIFWSKLLDDVEDAYTIGGLGSGYPNLRRINLGVEITF